MRITEKWLIAKGACYGGLCWFTEQRERDAIKIVNKLMYEDLVDWANWLVCRVLKTRLHKIAYAEYCARRVLPHYTLGFPEDKRSAKLLAMVRRYVANPTRSAARDLFLAESDARRIAYSTVSHTIGTLNAMNAAYAMKCAVYSVNSDDIDDTVNDASYYAIIADVYNNPQRFIDFGVKLIRKGLK